MPEQMNKRVKSDINIFKRNISAYYHTRMEAIVFIFLQDFSAPSFSLSRSLTENVLLYSNYPG